MKTTASLIVGFTALACAAPSGWWHHPRPHQVPPLVSVRNGTYEGVYSPEYDQDFFLGLPFAQPPVNDLRFSNPVSLNSSFETVQQATKYSPACVGYGPSQVGYNISEDCLYLNVIRPAGHHGHTVQGGLPVAVWIFGGGFVQGSGVDKRYNQSFIVQNSVNMGQPIISVTLNYRLSAWGFLQGEEVLASGNSNFGLRDQRLALHWIKENIASFGGDPEKVTIWGQSAGAGSVGLHITAYNGRDDGLFRGGILESGNPIYFGNQNQSAFYNAAYHNLTTAAGCDTAADSLTCLRMVPFAKLNSIVNTTALSAIWTPQIDGDIVSRHSSEQLADGAFVKVPIIEGATSDEGTSFAPPSVNTTAEFKSDIEATSPMMNDSFAEAILAAYPDDPSVEVLANLGPTFRPGPPAGPQYRRAATYYGDENFIANRRATCQTWAKAGLAAYCYRFNAIPAWADQLDGATHFVEVAFAMLNLLGVGYEPFRTPPFQGKPPSHTDLAYLMSSDWVSFIANGDPNAWRGRKAHGVPSWPVYSTSAPQDFVYDANVTSYVEADTWRSEGIDLINSGNLAVYGR
ncbi:hypothetical protein LTR56_014822 [Elasticomyces elasticus]|nr:hypothetical protein LTR56_014822 [Elasticomyces elasticus]KAK3644719.1 hypothetical protein LTR22_015094 [Elasticomyces elasticus]KAK4916104.1 hypothetical protein LTR49_015878 [Elasticomyces elasticus]KAK5755157.1 hypothetical protein LTS12_014721 [Elasticomyces elasticus]